MNKKICWKRST